MTQRAQRPRKLSTIQRLETPPDKPSASQQAVSNEELDQLLWDVIDDHLPERDLVRHDAAQVITDAILANTELLDALVAYRLDAQRFVIGQLAPHSLTFPREDMARAELDRLNAKYGERGLRLLRLTDITERAGE
ncbi:hypothetical protein [Nocardia sp. NPDC051463]|uniref:hypothetical protein n=1 Tax=Nocardia sp. NPDC051463 TaxID=3154845 RepID=UPI00344C289A